MQIVKRVVPSEIVQLDKDAAWKKVRQIQRASHVADAHMGRLFIELIDGGGFDAIELDAAEDCYDWIGRLIGKSRGHVSRLVNFARLLPWIEDSARKRPWLIAEDRRKKEDADEPPPLLLKERHCRPLVKCLPRAGTPVDDETGQRITEAFYKLADGAEHWAKQEEWAKPTLAYKNAVNVVAPFKHESRGPHSADQDNKEVFGFRAVSTAPGQSKPHGSRTPGADILKAGRDLRAALEILMDEYDIEPEAKALLDAIDARKRGEGRPDGQMELI